MFSTRKCWELRNEKEEEEEKKRQTIWMNIENGYGSQRVCKQIPLSEKN